MSCRPPSCRPRDNLERTSDSSRASRTSRTFLLRGWRVLEARPLPALYPAIGGSIPMPHRDVHLGRVMSLKVALRCPSGMPRRYRTNQRRSEEIWDGIVGERYRAVARQMVRRATCCVWYMCVGKNGARREEATLPRIGSVRRREASSLKVALRCPSGMPRRYRTNPVPGAG